MSSVSLIGKKIYEIELQLHVCLLEKYQGQFLDEQVTEED